MKKVKKMNTEEYLVYLREGKRVSAGSGLHEIMHRLSQEALEITAELNNGYHSPEEIRSLMERLTGRKIAPSFSMFPPFYSECGRNIFLGKNVFINFGCHFQDQGGIYIGDGTLIGSGVVIATINHDLDPARRHDNIPSPVHIGKNVWIGSHATILPGVTVGDDAVIAAGAVVTKDVPEKTVAAGVPARVIRNI